MKTITVEDKIWQELTKIKADLMASDISQVISLALEEYKKSSRRKA